MVDGTPSVKQVPRTGGKLGVRGDVAAKPELTELTENSPQSVTAATSPPLGDHFSGRVLPGQTATGAAGGRDETNGPCARCLCLPLHGINLDRCYHPFEAAAENARIASSFPLISCARFKTVPNMCRMASSGFFP